MAFNMRATCGTAGDDRSGPDSARSRAPAGGSDAPAAQSAGSAPLSQAAGPGRADDEPGAPPTSDHSARDLETIFRRCFEASHATTLEGGGDEPLYLASAAPEHAPHRIVYRADYFASALHEVAHWCLAGAARRRLDDYGYWYHPDGRTPEQQRDFERVEARPQALEWIFADACGHAFHLSADNLDGGAGPSARFAEAVARERRALEARGLPTRAARFARALRAWFAGDGDGAHAASRAAP